MAGSKAVRCGRLCNLSRRRRIAGSAAHQCGADAGSAALRRQHQAVGKLCHLSTALAACWPSQCHRRRGKGSVAAPRCCAAVDGNTCSAVCHAGAHAAQSFGIQYLRSLVGGKLEVATTAATAPCRCKSFTWLQICLMLPAKSSEALRASSSGHAAHRNYHQSIRW